MESINKEILVVDLDGTLLNSDILHESFWSAFSLDSLSFLKSLFYLFKGKAKLKEYLYTASNIDVKSLPYNKVVIRYIANFKNSGGRVVLATASNEKFAKKIADHLGFFDEVYGSNSLINLKGEIKAKFLVNKFGEKNFIYIGDSRADLAIWRRAKKSISINCSKLLQKKIERQNLNYEHLSKKKINYFSYLKTMRLYQWIKNLLIFLPIFAAHQVNIPSISTSFIAFFAFSFFASSVYIINDLLDLSADRNHEIKKMRPLASSDLSIFHGEILAFVLIVIGLILGSFLGLSFVFTLLIYYFLSTIYSLSLKKYIIIDICILALLFTLRIVAGSFATEIDISFWLIAFSIFIFFSLASVKRQAELVNAKKLEETQINRRGYNIDDLPIISAISLNAGYISVLIMAFYINSPSVTKLYYNPSMLWGICFVLLYWLTRIVFLTNRGIIKNDDPIIFATKDNISLICFFSIIGFLFLGTLN